MSQLWDEHEDTIDYYRARSTVDGSLVVGSGKDRSCNVEAASFCPISRFMFQLIWYYSKNCFALTAYHYFDSNTQHRLFFDIPSCIIISLTLRAYSCTHRPLTVYICGFLAIDTVS
jgi:hypothetical protein